MSSQHQPVIDQLIDAVEEIASYLRRFIATKTGKRRRWSDEERAVVREMYPDTPAWMIGWILGRPESGVHKQAAMMGVRKKPDWHLDPWSGTTATNPQRGINGRFRKGHVPANKGVKGWEAGGRSAETRFKPGHRPQQWKPIGTEVVDVNGYRKRKVRDGMQPAVYNWEFVHVLLWEEHNGPVPDGHMVRFKNGRKTDIRIENLELVSLADNMRRNSYHRYGPEIARAIQLKGQLTRKINRRIRDREKQNR